MQYFRMISSYFLKKFFLAVDCISWTAEMHILFYASPTFNILPIDVPSVANCKVVSSKYIFDKVDAVTPYYVTAGTSHQEMNLFSSLMMKTRVIN